MISSLKSIRRFRVTAQDNTQGYRQSDGTGQRTRVEASGREETKDAARRRGGTRENLRPNHNILFRLTG